MKRLNISILLIFISLNLFCQTWPKYYGEPGKWDYPTDILESYDKGYLICGNYYTYNSGEFKRWTWLIKTDINGELLWDKIIEDSETLIKTVAIDETSDGGLLLGGIANINPSTSYPYLLKLNSCAEKEWCRIFSTTQFNSWIQDVKEDEHGDIVALVNWFESEQTMHLFKLNASGDLLWQNPYGYALYQSYQPSGKSVYIVPGNKYLICGHSYWKDPWQPNGNYIIRPTFTLVDEYGEQEWSVPFGLEDSIIGVASDVIESYENRFVGAGSFWGDGTDIYPLLVLFDSTSNEINHRIVQPNEIDTIFTKGTVEQIEKSDSLLYLTGDFANTASPTVISFIVDTTFLTSNAKIIKSFTRTDEAWPYPFEMTNDSKFISGSILQEPNDYDIAFSKFNTNLEYDTVYSGNKTYDSLCNHSIQSGFISLNDCIIVDIQEMPTPQQYYARIKTIPITVYPNPATDNVHFKLENTEHNKNIQLKCFDLLGTEVCHASIIPGQKEAAADVSAWQQGMYMVVVYSEGKVVGKAKMVVWK